MSTPATSMAVLAATAAAVEREERRRFRAQVYSPRSDITDPEPSRKPDDDPALMSIAVQPPAHLEGRVFMRLHQYHILPQGLQLETDAMAVYLLTPGVLERVFTPRTWLHLFEGGHRRRRRLWTKGDHLVQAIQERLATIRSQDPSVEHAQQIAEALVLCGFVSPVREPKYKSTVLQYVNPKDSYELIAPVAQANPAEEESARFNVWAVIDGATRAGFLFRKIKSGTAMSILHSFALCPSSYGDADDGDEKECYAVINKAKYHAIFFFRTDVAREETEQMDLSHTTVQYDSGSTRSPLYHGLRLQQGHHVEHLDFLTKEKQGSWLLSLLDGGARYQEVSTVHRSLASSKASFYALKDIDIQGREVRMSGYRDRVTLIVNIATQDPEADLQFPDLVELHHRYHHSGLRIVVFPSDQLGGLELAVNRDILEHLDKRYRVRFPVMRKRDVNGPGARNVFVYLNAHLPGPYGAFTEWNFVKFLVDRTGRPYKRFDSTVLPLALTGEIDFLLSAEPNARVESHHHLSEIQLHDSI